MFCVLIRSASSDGYSQHKFSWRNKKKILWILPLIRAIRLSENLRLSVQSQFFQYLNKGVAIHQTVDESQ